MIGGGEIIGIGAVCLALVGLLTKVWLDHSKLSRKVIDVVERNATAAEGLKSSITENTSVTKETKALMHETKLMMIKINGYHDVEGKQPTN